MDKSVNIIYQIFAVLSYLLQIIEINILNYSFLFASKYYKFTPQTFLKFNIPWFMYIFK